MNQREWFLNQISKELGLKKNNNKKNNRIIVLHS